VWPSDQGSCQQSISTNLPMHAVSHNSMLWTISSSMPCAALLVEPGSDASQGTP
jgi:hypothetical protein